MINSVVLYAIWLVVYVLPAQALEYEIGVDAMQTSIQVMTKDGADLGIIESHLTYIPSVAVKSTHAYFEDSQWGYFYALDYQYFNVNLQGDPKAVDIGTRIEGQAVHFTPTLFYTFVGEQHIDHKAWQTTLGIGLGLGYMQFKGNMLSNLAETPMVIKANHGGFGLSAGVYMEISKGDWFTRVAGFGPSLETALYDYQFVNVSFTVVGYRYDFDL